MANADLIQISALAERRETLGAIGISIRRQNCIERQAHVLVEPKQQLQECPFIDVGGKQWDVGAV